MRHFWSCSALAVLSLCALAIAEPTLTIKPALGPSAYGSPSWTGFVNNAITALKEKRDSVGDLAQNATAFQVVDSVQFGELLVGSLPLWRGQLKPTGTFAAESGNRLHFTLHVIGNGQRFSLADVAYEVTSGDAKNLLAMKGTLADVAYSAGRVGIDYGPDRKRGSDDDIVFQDGEPATVPVDELYYVGIGVGLEYEQLPAVEGADENQRLLALLQSSEIGRKFPLSIQYQVRTPQGQALATAQASVTVQAPPGEPSALPLFIGIGAAIVVVGGMFAYKKQRRGPISVADKI